MTPGERDYDIKLVAGARNMARWIYTRSRKAALTINQLADRLDALSSAAVEQQKSQPASAPEQPARD